MNAAALAKPVHDTSPREPAVSQRGPAWLHARQAQQALDTARQLIQGVVPQATFAERERLILVLLRELACQTLEAELQMLDTSLPSKLQTDGAIYHKGRSRLSTFQSPVGPLYVHTSVYHTFGPDECASEPLATAAGCVGQFTPALVERVQNGTPAIDAEVPAPVLAQLQPPPRPSSRPPQLAPSRVSLPPHTSRVVPTLASQPQTPEPSTAAPPPTDTPQASVAKPPRGSRRAKPRLGRLLGATRRNRSRSIVVSVDEPWWDEPRFIEPDGDERRQHRRARVELAVELGGNHQFYSGFAADLSSGGIFVATHAIKPIGEEVEFSVCLPDKTEPIEGLAKVRWVREYSDNSDVPPGMGLEFVDVSENDLAHIDHYVACHDTLFWEP